MFRCLKAQWIKVLLVEVDVLVQIVTGAAESPQTCRPQTHIFIIIPGKDSR
jgi:hypothetical protein